MIKLMKLVRGIKHYFAVINNNIFFIDTDNCIAKLNIYNDNKYLLAKGEFQTLANIKDEIWAFDASLMNTIIIKGDDISYLPFVVGLFNGNYIKDNIYIARIRQDNSRYFIKIDLTQKFIEKKYLSESSNIGMFKIISNDVFVSYKDNLLTCHPLSSDEEKWRIDLNVLLDAERATVYGDMFEHQGRLFFFVSDVRAGIGATFCISLETGKVIKKIEGFGGWLQFVDGQFYVLGRKELKILNPDTFDKTVIDFSEVLAPHNWDFTWNKYVIAHNRLYFLNENVGGGGTANVGILDIATQKLLWHTDIAIETGKYWIADIKVHDNRLYVLTQGGTLYVYEEEIAKL